ncbi:zinc finger CCCH domain-containing protein 46 isoform X2 [Telopea speciosissima]|uniref:zinc finger CCCH domain-containing protein 46 isoform X2 n=1 Tax=Telopea speciosissima TaxID=54955 RepID=UPI001CC5F61C|nr:zinc finger CCCH domain-containing protein 46 isoform X2 [Telopea speciosissima]
MYRKKDPCRNFQRGSCHFGENCKYLHVNQQQPKPNPFGFGTGSQFQQTNQQQQKSNPFGFGVQNNSKPKEASDFGSKYQNQFKPFENKWTRSSSVPAANSTSRQADNQSQASHKCTESELCKRQIVEDFQNERPLWKLTCYGHSKYGPCDIVGDISYEELRAEAYKDAKQGLSLQSIVERERNLLNSKLIEFDNLLRNPYVISSNSTATGASSFSGINSNASVLSVPNSGPPSLSSFSQLGSSLKLGGSTWFPVSSTNAFGQSISSHTPGGLGMDNLTFGSKASFGSQQPMQAFSSAVTFNIPNISSSNFGAGSGPFHVSSPMPTQFPNHTTNDSYKLPNVVGQASMDTHSVDSKKIEAIAGDGSIWLKDWKPGEIPEEEPPQQFIYPDSGDGSNQKGR